MANTIFNMDNLIDEILTDETYINFINESVGEIEINFNNLPTYNTTSISQYKINNLPIDQVLNIELKSESEYPTGTNFSISNSDGTKVYLSNRRAYNPASSLKRLNITNNYKFSNISLPNLYSLYNFDTYNYNDDKDQYSLRPFLFKGISLASYSNLVSGTMNSAFSLFLKSSYNMQHAVEDNKYPSNSYSNFLTYGVYINSTYHYRIVYSKTDKEPSSLRFFTVFEGEVDELDDLNSWSSFHLIKIVDSNNVSHMVICRLDIVYEYIYSGACTCVLYPLSFGSRLFMLDVGTPGCLSSNGTFVRFNCIIDKIAEENAALTKNISTAITSDSDLEDWCYSNGADLISDLISVVGFESYPSSPEDDDYIVGAPSKYLCNITKGDPSSSYIIVNSRNCTYCIYYDDVDQDSGLDSNMLNIMSIEKQSNSNNYKAILTPNFIIPRIGAINSPSISSSPHESEITPIYYNPNLYIQNNNNSIKISLGNAAIYKDLYYSSSLTVPNITIQKYNLGRGKSANPTNFVYYLTTGDSKYYKILSYLYGPTNLETPSLAGMPPETGLRSETHCTYYPVGNLYSATSDKFFYTTCWIDIIV